MHSPTEDIPLLIPLILLLLPLLEIATFVLVGSEIGVLATIGLVLLSAVLGMFLLRTQGVSALARAQLDLRAGSDPGPQLVKAVMTVVAAVLLLIPGFLTDAVAILLLIPAVRSAVWRLLKGRLAASGRFASFEGGFGSTRWSGGRPAGRGNVIDLDEDDYSRDGNPGSPWRLNKDE